MKQASLAGLLILALSAYLCAETNNIQTKNTGPAATGEADSLTEHTQEIQRVSYLPAQQIATDRRLYEFRVLERALEITRDTHGDYTLNTWKGDDMTLSRGVREVTRGEIVNVASNPYSPDLDQEGIDLIRVPLMKGLLGYRAIVVRNADIEKFQTLTTKQFLELQIGQLEYWSDNAIYKANNLEVISGKSLDMLYSMLSRERFDYIPLGVGEVESMLDIEKKHDFDIGILPDTFIHYPFPVYLYVCACEPLLGERIRKGLERLQNNGELEKLFNAHFEEAWTKTHHHSARIINIDNPYLLNKNRAP